MFDLSIHKSSIVKPWTNSDFELCMRRAASHWAEWEPCFSSPSQSPNPILLDNPDLFTEFVQEFGLRWIGIRGSIESFRQKVRNNKKFEHATKKGCYRSLDAAVDQIRDGIGARQLSALSKIAMFSRTDIFLPVDRWSKRGVSLVTGSPNNYKDYETFHEDVSTLLKNSNWTNFKCRVLQHGLCPSVATSEQFYMRVVDIALMTIGGRWSKPALATIRSSTYNGLGAQHHSMSPVHVEQAR